MPVVLIQAQHWLISTFNWTLCIIPGHPGIIASIPKFLGMKKTVPVNELPSSNV